MATYGTTYTAPKTSPYTLASYRTPTQSSPGNNLASAFTAGPQNRDLASGSYYNQTRAPNAPVQAPTPYTAPGSAPAAAAAPVAPNVYDITTDPALQAITALTGRSDQDAQDAALKQEQGQLLGYGDPTLAQSFLGDPTLAQAAGANPTSTLAQLGQQRTRNLGDLTEGLNKQNLFYSGYRVTQEQQAAQDYQNALARAAAGVNSNLDTIQGNLAQTLAANQAQRIAALQAAALANPPGVAATDAAPSAATGDATGTPTVDPTVAVLNNAVASPAVNDALALALGTTGKYVVPTTSGGGGSTRNVFL